VLLFFRKDFSTLALWLVGGVVGSWLMRAVIIAGILVHLGLLGCSEESVPVPDGAGADLLATDSASDDAPAREAGTDITSTDTAPADLGADSAADATAPDASPAGYQVARGIIHLHSVYSHDGCDHQGLVGGVPNATCIKQLRDALCGVKVDFAMLTDHPAYMADYPMQDVLLHDAAAGDQLVLEAGAPIANRITCAGGHQILLSAGFEDQHSMPLGLHGKPPATDLVYDGITDATDPATIQQRVQTLKGLGAVVAIVHSEQSNISASTITAGGFEAMEWYNIHANFSALLGSDTLSVDIAQLGTLINKLLDLTDFLGGATGGPHADLVYLVFLDVMPPEGFTKWQEVQRTHRVTGMLGSDIHQNVTVDPSMCAGAAMQLACIAGLALVESALGVTLPASLKQVILSGGTLDLSDGDRIDSYGRLMRWLENRVLVTQLEPVAIQEGLRNGRAYGVLTVFGDPHLFSFTGQQAGKTLVLGETASGPVTLEVVAPDRPVAMSSAPFTQAEALTAELRTRLLRTDSAGTTLVKEVLGLGATISQSVSQPGAYHVEVRITPKHLATALGSSKALADKEYLWVITNPIVVQ
jgi:hypothetical protein